METPEKKKSKLYRISNKYVARDMAALDFLAGIPLEREADIVKEGFSKISIASKGKWWEKIVKTSVPFEIEEEAQELERPSKLAIRTAKTDPNIYTSAYAVPGRRLQGDARTIKVQIPLTTETLTRQKTIARQAALREWELQTAHGLSANQQQPLLNGRLFFSAAGAYPISTFSLIRYEPRKEEAALRRQKLEARGGGGSQFAMPARDWRGISYRALLPREGINSHKAFNRFLNHDEYSDDDTLSSESSGESDAYETGLLDDPEMKLGKHQNLTVGDKVIGPIVSSTIQFVKPTVLKAELNKQFRDRFDGWEPPRAARKYIGAKVIDGEYRLMDPADDFEDSLVERRSRQGSIASSLNADGTRVVDRELQIRMPPSLTLSKIRSLKHQALQAAVKAKVEISTIALACVYFERLCLDCRVDKSNRRLTFSVCMLLAAKINEQNISLVMKRGEHAQDENVTSRIQSLYRPNKRSDNMFASLLEFFTQDWNLTLKSIFDAEFGVFAALRFELHATPQQVAFHFRRLMKSLGWNSLEYLGDEMYRQWQEALEDEERRRKEREDRKERMQRRKEERLLDLQIEIENEVLRRNELISESEDEVRSDKVVSHNPLLPSEESPSKDKSHHRKSGIKLLHRFGRMRKAVSQERLQSESGGEDNVGHRRKRSLGDVLAGVQAEIVHSPSMPSFPTVSEDASLSAALPQESVNDDDNSTHSYDEEKGLSF